MEKNIINIPTKLLSAYLSNKESAELLALACIIKGHYGSSSLLHFSPKKIKLICGCCIEKARKLYKEALLDTKLFRYDKKTNILYANKLTKRRAILYYGKNQQFKAEVLNCVKVDLSKNFRLKDAVRNLREKAIGKVISMNDGNESLKQRKSSCATKCSLSLGNIASTVGLSKTCVYGITRKMKKEGLIKRSPTSIFFIHSELDTVPFEYDYVIKEQVVKKGITYIKSIAIKVGEWSIESKDFKDCYSHIIFNHRKRLSSKRNKVNYNLAEPPADVLSKDFIEAYFNTMEH